MVLIKDSIALKLRIHVNITKMLLRLSLCKFIEITLCLVSDLVYYNIHLGVLNLSEYTQVTFVGNETFL